MSELGKPRWDRKKQHRETRNGTLSSDALSRFFSVLRQSRTACWFNASAEHG